MSTAVGIIGVRKTFPGSSQPALAGVTIDIRKNEFFTLLGPSGCGKTTLLRMVAGFEALDGGEISIDGIAMGRTPPNRRPVNTVFQSYALFPHMTVAQNIAFALDMLGKPREAIRARVQEILLLLQLDGMAERKPSQLSGGQQQRVALGRALAPEPKVLLLDEPLSALDLKLRKEMQLELKRLQAKTGITFIFVTHDQEEAITMSDRVAVMRGGQVMQLATPHEIYEAPANLFVAGFVGEANLLSAVCRTRDGAMGQFTLAGGGASITARAIDDVAPIGPGTAVTLMVRPERVRPVSADTATLQGVVAASVYSGSDLMIHATLANGETLRARLSTANGASQPVGTTAGFAINTDTVRAFAS